MKIAFGMIVFNGGFVLEECLKSVYPFAHQILIAEGPVGYWQSQGFTTSTDETNEILQSFPDPEGKITIVRGQYSEKDEQCSAYMKHLDPSCDYVWNLDSDEIFKPEDIETIIKLLTDHRFTTAGFQSCSFYGGFDRILGGFEENAEFRRICKVYPGSRWKTHSPPTRAHPSPHAWPESRMDFKWLWENHGIRMYHYSYVFPDQVYNKVQYYKAAVSMDNCIDDYFSNVYLPWVTSEDNGKESIENHYNGVHEFKPQFRGECRTKMFDAEHPQIVQENMEFLKQRFDSQLRKYV